MQKEIGVILLNGFTRNYDKFQKYNMMIGMLDVDDDPEVIHVLMKKRDEAYETHRNYLEIITKGDLAIFPEVLNNEQNELFSSI